MLALAGCATPPRPAPPTLSEEPSSVAALAAAIEADAKRSDHEPDSKIRGDLAAEAEGLLKIGRGSAGADSLAPLREADQGLKRQ